MPSACRRHALAVTALLLLGAPDARAQSSPSEIAAAKEQFHAGLDLEKAGSWKEALEHFRRAAAVKQTPQIGFHVGLCESRSGDLVDAIVDLNRAVAMARDKGLSDVESAATAELADARSRAPTLEVDAPAGRAQRFLVDGSAVATAMLGSPLPLNPGEHLVAVEFDTGRAEKKVTLAEREVKKVPFEPPTGAAASIASSPATATPNATSNATPTPTSSTPTEPSSSSHVVPWVLVAGGGALLAGGVVFFVLRQNELSTLQSGCPTSTGCNPSLQSDYNSGKTDTTVAYVLGGVGIAAAAVGAGMLLFGGSSSHEASAMVVPSAVPGGGGAAVVGRF